MTLAPESCMTSSTTMTTFSARLARSTASLRLSGVERPVPFKAYTSVDTGNNSPSDPLQSAHDGTVWGKPGNGGQRPGGNP